MKKIMSGFLLALSLSTVPAFAGDSIPTDPCERMAYDAAKEHVFWSPFTFHGLEYGSTEKYIDQNPIPGLVHYSVTWESPTSDTYGTFDVYLEVKDGQCVKVHSCKFDGLDS